MRLVSVVIQFNITIMTKWKIRSNLKAMVKLNFLFINKNIKRKWICWPLSSRFSIYFIFFFFIVFFLYFDLFFLFREIIEMEKYDSAMLMWMGSDTKNKNNFLHQGQEKDCGWYGTQLNTARTRRNDRKLFSFLIVHDYLVFHLWWSDVSSPVLAWRWPLEL